MRPFTVVSMLLAAAAVACRGDTIQSPANLTEIQAQALPLFVLDCPPGFIFGAEAGSGADRNGDGIVCNKVTAGGIVTIDNNAKGPPRKKA